MVDKEKYTSFITDEEAKKVIVKNLSKLDSVLKNYDVRITDFLDPYQMGLFCSVLNSFEEVSCQVFGGADEFERSLVAIFPSYMEKSEIDIPIAAIKITSYVGFEKISHRDVLGSALGLGIAREKIGDIHVHEDEIFLIATKEIAIFLAGNLNKISNASVSTELIDIEDIKIKNPELVEKTIFVPSLRLDAVLSSAFGMARSKASKLASSNKIKLDFRPVSNPSENLEKVKLVSVKGYGRFTIFDEMRKTKKDNIALKIGIYK